MGKIEIVSPQWIGHPSWNLDKGGPVYVGAHLRIHIRPNEGILFKPDGFHFFTPIFGSLRPL